MSKLGGHAAILITACSFLVTIAQTSQCLAKQAPQPASAPSLSTIVVEQSNDIYGRTRTYINNVGVKIELIGTNVAVVAKAPTWCVVFYNKATKKGLSFSKEEWMHHHQHTTYSGQDWDRSTLALGEPSKINKFGRQALRYKVMGNSVPNGVSPNAKVKNAEYIELATSPASQEAISIMRKCLSTPSSTGIPLEMINHLPLVKTVAFKSTASGDQTYLRTLNIETKHLPVSIFDYPAQIIAEKSEAGVLNDAQKQQRINDAFNTFLD